MAWYKRDILAYRADTAHLTTLEHGAYTLLIDEYMSTRMPPLDNDQALANTVHLPLAAWMEIASTIRAFFKPKGGRLHQKRCDSVLEVQDRQGLERSEHAKNAAKKRWGENNNLNASSIVVVSNGHAQPMLNDAREKEEKKNKKESSANGHLHLTPGIEVETAAALFERWYKIYPLHKAKGTAEKAFKKAVAVAGGIEPLLVGAQRYALECHGKESKFIAHPATWLNARRWEDEPAQNQAVASRALL